MRESAGDVVTADPSIAAEVKDGSVARAGNVEGRVNTIDKCESMWLPSKDVPTGHVTAFIEAGKRCEAGTRKLDVRELAIDPDKSAALVNGIFPVADDEAIRVDGEGAGERRTWMVDDD